MERNNSIQKIENHLSQEIKKTNFSHSTIKEIFFIQEITDNLLTTHNLRIPQELTNFIKKYSVLSRSVFFKNNFKEYFAPLNEIFRKQWYDFDIPLQLYPRLPIEQKKVLSKVFKIEPHHYDHSHLQTYITEEDVQNSIKDYVNAKSNNKPVEDYNEKLYKKYNVSKIIYPRISTWQEYKDFLLLPVELRKCVSYLPQSINNKPEKQPINPEQGITSDKTISEVAMIISKNKKFNGYWILPICPSQETIKLIMTYNKT
jgi:hypothetical protein